MKFCETCKVKKVKNEKVNKYCSKTCYTKSRIGLFHSKETKDKIRTSNSKPHSEERKRHISEGKKRNMSEIQREIFCELLKKWYYPHSLIQKEIKAGNKAKYYNWLREILLKSPELKEIELKRVRKFQLKNGLTLKKIDWIIKHGKNYTLLQVHKELKLTMSPQFVNSFVKKYFKVKFKREPYRFHLGATKPELVFEEWLKEMGYCYIYNFPIESERNNGINYYLIDFVIENKIAVEIQGDYWHGNPEVYTVDQLNGIQRSAINRDRRKKATILTQTKLEYYAIWEKDQKNNTEIYKNIKKQIQCTLQKHSLPD